MVAIKKGNNPGEIAENRRQESGISEIDGNQETAQYPLGDYSDGYTPIRNEKNIRNRKPSQKEQYADGEERNLAIGWELGDGRPQGKDMESHIEHMSRKRRCAGRRLNNIARNISWAKYGIFRYEQRAARIDILRKAFGRHPNRDLVCGSKGTSRMSQFDASI